MEGVPVRGYPLPVSRQAPRAARLARVGLALLTVGAAACGSEGEERRLAVPQTGTDYLIWATAPEGRSAQPESVRIARTADVGSLAAEPIGGGDVDMFVAGLMREELPAGLDPLELVIVDARDERAHALPRLHAPHVLASPTAPGRSALFVPAGRDADEELAERLRVITSGLAVRDPCEEPSAPIEVAVPRTPGEEIRALRLMPSGETLAAFVATSTAILGVVRPGSDDVELIGVGTSTTTVRAGERVRIGDLGDTEARRADGRVLPSAVSLNLIGAFGGVGTIAVLDEGAGNYREDFIRDPAAEQQGIGPGLLPGVRHLDLEGVPSLCAFGGARGSNRVAGVWCRAASGGAWRLVAAVPEAFLFLDLIAREPPLRPLVIDVAATIYELTPEGLEPVRRSSLNDGCRVPCVAFGRVLVERRGAALTALIAGSEAEVLRLESDASGRITLESLDVVSTVLFADERRGADAPIEHSSLAIAPDGALWIGSQAPFLIRVGDTRDTAKRICLPQPLHGAETSAILAHPSGDLYLGLTPALLGFGSWRE